MTFISVPGHLFSSSIHITRRHSVEFSVEFCILAIKNALFHTEQHDTYHVAKASITNGVSHSCSIISSCSPVTNGAALTSSLASSAMNSLVFCAAIVGVVGNDAKAFAEETKPNTMQAKQRKQIGVIMESFTFCCDLEKFVQSTD